MQPMHNRAKEITISKADYIHVATGDEQHGVKPIDTVAEQRTWSKGKERNERKTTSRVAGRSSAACAMGASNCWLDGALTN